MKGMVLGYSVGSGKSRGKESMNDAIREVMGRMPDPLHLDLPHVHKRFLELAYVLVVLGAIVSILIYGTILGWPSTVVNASLMLVMALGIILTVMFIEKSSIVHKHPVAHKPENTSS